MYAPIAYYDHEKARSLETKAGRNCNAISLAIKYALLTKHASSFVCLSLLMFSSTALGQNKLQDLSNKVADLQQSQNIMPHDASFADCSDQSAAALAQQASGLVGHSQYIYNSTYRWTSMPTASGECIYFQYPENRGLNKSEAQTLLDASSMDFPVDHPTNDTQQRLYAPVSPNDNLLKNATMMPDPISQTGSDSATQKTESDAGTVPVAKKTIGSEKH
jgi:hypothetical protein